MAEAASAIISPSALSKRLGEPRLRILDASWHMPADGRDAAREFVTEHIPGAQFFDIDAVSDRHSPYPHMLPDAEHFAAAVSALGIRNEDTVVVYDSQGLFSAARLWWMFRAFGHDKVLVLDGGLPKWKAEGLKLQPGNASPATASFRAKLRPELLRDRQAVAENIATPQELLLDARAPGRFAGSEPEPRPGLHSGHIPGSVNVYFRDCLNPPYNTLKSREELAALFAGKKADTKAKLAATCGSGVTACILALALYELGNRGVGVYDGAWAEWGSLAETA